MEEGQLCSLAYRMTGHASFLRHPIELSKTLILVSHFLLDENEHKVDDAGRA